MSCNSTIYLSSESTNLNNNYMQYYTNVSYRKTIDVGAPVNCINTGKCSATGSSVNGVTYVSFVSPLPFKCIFLHDQSYPAMSILHQIFHPSSEFIHRNLGRRIVSCYQGCAPPHSFCFSKHLYTLCT